MTSVFIKRENLGSEIHIERALCEETQGEDGHQKAKGRVLEQVFFSVLGGTNPADASVSDSSLQNWRQ